MDTTNLDKVSDEKRLKVINAGILCFSRSGYKKTAISEIAKEAGISKTAVFHYFGTKKDLYMFLFNYIADELIKGVSEIIAEGIKDFFECATAYMKIRVRLCEKHPGMYELFRSNAEKRDYKDVEELGAIESERIEQCVSMIFVGSNRKI